ncbi:hypothetical protein L915_20023, partial [Phytophthora nicotianae]
WSELERQQVRTTLAVETGKEKTETVRKPVLVNSTKRQRV